MSDVLEHAQRTPISIQQAERAGWPEQPRVTTEEELLYAEEAGLVRLLGQAATATERAYRTACMLRSEFPEADALPERPFANEADVDALDKAVTETSEAHVKARLAYRNAAARATERFRHEATEVTLTGPGGEALPMASGTAVAGAEHQA
jgi:hypothetical protein